MMNQIVQVPRFSMGLLSQGGKKLNRFLLVAGLNEIGDSDAHHHVLPLEAISSAIQRLI